MREIILVCNEYPRRTAWGGMATFTYEYATALAERDHDVSVITDAWDGPPEVRTEENVTVYRIKRNPNNPSADYMNPGLPSYHHSFGIAVRQQILRMPTNDSTIVEVTDFGGICTYIRDVTDALISARMHSPMGLIVQLNDLARFPGSRPHSSSFDQLSHTEMIERDAALIADVRISPSQALITLLQDRWEVPRNAFAFCPYGVRASSIKNSIPDRSESLLFAARLEPRKGFSLFLRALPMVLDASNANVIVAGEVPQAAIAEIYAAVPHRHRARVRIVGHQPRDIINDLLSRSKVFCHPSMVFDNSPLAVIEAMHNGCGIVATRVGGIPELLDNGECGLLVDEDPNALAASLTHLLKDTSLAASLGTAATLRAREYYSLDRLVRDSFNIYDEAHSTRASKRAK